MWDEENEADDSGQADAVETTEAAEPAEAPAETVEAAPQEATESSSDVEAAPEVFDWNGELESLKQEQWFNELNENMRESMLGGFETKYQNWARGYQKKFDEL